jgi:hypothetical protein
VPARARALVRARTHVCATLQDKLETIEPHARDETVLLFSAHGVPMQARCNAPALQRPSCVARCVVCPWDTRTPGTLSTRVPGSATQ